MKKLILILPLLYYSCTDDILADIDALQTDNAEQDAQIDSLMTALNEQQAYIDSLIGESSINDSLIQEYTDSLNTVQNAYIDSLHNAQQTTLEALANTALNGGFEETIVFNDTIIVTNSDVEVEQDLDLSSFIGENKSVVLIRANKGIDDEQGAHISIAMHPADIDTSIMNYNYQGDEVFTSGQVLYFFVETDPLGVIKWSYYQGNSNIWSHHLTFTLLFYIN